MPPRKPHFDLVQSEIDALPNEVGEWFAKNTSIVDSLCNVLHDFVTSNRLPPALAARMMRRVMPAYIRAFQENVFDKSEVKIMGEKNNIEYNRYHDIHTFWVPNATILLPAGEPNPLDGWVPPPPKSKRIRGEGKADDPYDLTDANADLPIPVSSPKTTELAVGNPSEAAGSKRSHSNMTGEASQSTTTKDGKNKPYTITVPYLKIIMHPSALARASMSMPKAAFPALAKRHAELETQRLIDAGKAKAVVHRLKPNRPRKKKKTEVKVERADLEEDEPELEPEQQPEQQPDVSYTEGFWPEGEDGDDGGAFA